MVKIAKNDQNGLEWSKIWSKIVQNYPKWWKPSKKKLYWPERPKGAKDEVKKPEGPPARIWGPEGLNF